MTRALTWLLVLVVLVFAVTVIPGVRAQPGFDPLWDGWLQLSGYVLAAVVTATRPLQRSYQRDMWTLIAVSLGLRALGFLLYVPWIRTQVPQPYPSVADVAWLLSSVVLLVALTYRLRVLAPRMSNALMLDALTGALTAAALALALLYGAMVDLNAQTDASATATNLAYPVIDVAQLIVVVSLLTAVGWRPPRARAVLAVGIVTAAVVDCVFLYQVSAGTYRPGTWLSALTLASGAVIAVSSQMDDGPGRTHIKTSAPSLNTPLVCALVCIGILVYAAFEPVAVLALFLAVAGLVVAMTRALFTLYQDREVAEQELSAAEEETMRFQSLVETSSDFIAIAGVDGHVRYVNPAGRRMVGLGLDADVRGTTIADYLTEEGIRASLEVERPAVMAHGHWEGESTLRDMRGGPPIPVAISSFLMRNPDTGQPFGLATVQRDISERLANIRTLRRLADERQELLSRLVAAQEDERARIAADVHDDSVQVLAALELRLSLLRTKAQKSAPELLDATDSALSTVRDATVRLRELLFDLERPAQGTDLASAIDSAAHHVFEGPEVRITMTGDRTLDLPEASRITAYRIAKEALFNVRKHAGAREVTIVLAREREGVLLTIDDDGVGVDDDALRDRHGHLGLPGMRDRATVAGGRLVVAARPEGGTRVRLWLPDGAAPHETFGEDDLTP